MPKRTDIQKILLIGSGPDRHRAGLRVRLLGHPGLQGPAGGGLRGGAGQLEPGHHHDRPGDGRPHLHRAARARGGGARSSSSSGPTRCCPPWAARPALNLAVALAEDGTLDRYGVRADRRQATRHPDRPRTATSSSARRWRPSACAMPERGWSTSVPEARAAGMRQRRMRSPSASSGPASPWGARRRGRRPPRGVRRRGQGRARRFARPPGAARGVASSAGRSSSSR